jgi:hypothetical protein
MGVNHRRRNIFMPQQLLDGTDVCAALQGMRRETMTERVAARSFRQSCSRYRQLDRFVNRGFVQVMATGNSGAGVLG